MLIIFDCDGVLVDSEILSAQVDSEILGEYGYEITPEELGHRYAGLTTDRIFELAGEAHRPVHSARCASPGRGGDGQTTRS
jgi:beta-phosphoglucomutase-like phosphatase (HAD superfamily)